LKSRDEVVAELQNQHEEQLSRLTQLSKDREAAWTRQKEEMEQHYAQLLTDLQSRSKVRTETISNEMVCVDVDVDDLYVVRENVMLMLTVDC